MSKKVSLPTPRELNSCASALRKRLTQIFASRKSISWELQGNLAVGLARIEEKRRVAIVLATYMNKRRIRSVEELANRLYLDGEYLEALKLVRFPSSFHRVNKRQGDSFLLALCDLEWDPKNKCFNSSPLISA